MPRTRTALLSVFDKTGLREFASGLVDLGVTILSSGGTAAHLREAGIPVTDVSEYTGFPEMMDGRVKTLHPKIHGGLLALRDSAEHMAAAEKHGITLIDLVAVNLYPFEATVARPGVTMAEAVENIDIGGPSMLRSAAKNHRFVTVVSNPARYPTVLAEMRAGNGEVSDSTRLSLARETFAQTARYDSAIYNYLFGQSSEVGPLPESFLQPFIRAATARYGENPHQQGAFYRRAAVTPTGLAAARQLHGRELSFNNYLDLEAVLGFVREMAAPAVMIVKHNNPCGAAQAATLAEAYRDALATDPMSAFGGIIGLSQPVDEATAQAVVAGMQEYGYMECILAPGYAPPALELLQASKRDLRLLALPDLAAADPLMFRQVSGGLLVQTPDTEGDPVQMQVVTRRAPTEAELTSLRFAWLVCKHTKSNSIVLAQGTKAVGIGGGVTSRVDAAQLAVKKAGDRAKGAVMASDAYFPYPDALEAGIAAGVTAVIQPGGSKMRGAGDDVVIEACDRAGVAMVFTGVRHFRH